MKHAHIDATSAGICYRESAIAILRNVTVRGIRWQQLCLAKNNTQSFAYCKAWQCTAMG